MKVADWITALLAITLFVTYAVMPRSSSQIVAMTWVFLHFAGVPLLALLTVGMQIYRASKSHDALSRFVGILLAALAALLIVALIAHPEWPIDWLDISFNR